MGDTPALLLHIAKQNLSQELCEPSENLKDPERLRLKYEIAVLEHKQSLVSRLAACTSTPAGTRISNCFAIVFWEAFLYHLQ